MSAGMKMTADEVRAALRSAARGSWGHEAAVELLIGAYCGRFAAEGWEWITTAEGDPTWRAIDPDELTAWLERSDAPVSTGERVMLTIAASLAGVDAPCVIGDVIHLDAPTVSLVGRAVEHAGKGDQW